MNRSQFYLQLYSLYHILELVWLKGLQMSHKKTWACIKPDGDGCDGNHKVEYEIVGKCRDGIIRRLFKDGKVYVRKSMAERMCAEIETMNVLR